MNAELTIKSAIHETLPTVFGYLGIGIAFGLVGHAAGLSPLMIFLMSAIIYGGSAQFITVSLLAAGSPILSIVAATFLINSRMILLSLTIAPYFKRKSLADNIFIGTLLTDESFALGMNKLNYTAGELNFPWLNTANLIAYLTWVSASLIGGLLGNFIQNPERFGLDFAIVAMFIGLLYLQVIADKSLNYLLQITVIAVTLVLTYLGMIIIPSSLLVLVVTIIGCLLGVSLKKIWPQTH
ncbi:AzlC family ABC transporter permease [Lapidilactobacillus wuchangensis]|uniref:AzlC family ABC transporter permease n=1 Tax=Lapidilactobacillus wuchangensis TaxID=2486001 RepID=UPI000F7B70A2|nr:AzlC family ABC transporter permease [Lapidilactobacillus wuchangensis]